MDQLKYQNIATLTQSIKAHNYLLKLTQLFISVSVCSFIFSPSSLLVFFHYFKFYFSTFPFQLFTHNIDKNCMFLLCNGLLVFVGLTKSFSGSTGDDKPSNNNLEEEGLSSQYIEEDGSQSRVLDVKTNESVLEKETEEKIGELDEEQNTAAEHAIEIKNSAEEEQGNIEKIILVDEGQGKGKEEEEELGEESEVFDADDEEEEKGLEIDDSVSVIEENREEEEDEEEEEEESCMLSTEELNKKFEDFIRKMKEDLRIEARRQLVMV